MRWASVMTRRLSMSSGRTSAIMPRSSTSRVMISTCNTPQHSTQPIPYTTLNSHRGRHIKVSKRREMTLTLQETWSLVMNTFRYPEQKKLHTLTMKLCHAKAPPVICMKWKMYTHTNTVVPEPPWRPVPIVRVASCPPGLGWCKWWQPSWCFAGWPHQHAPVLALTSLW